jgi:hypothetical protein
MKVQVHVAQDGSIHSVFPLEGKISSEGEKNESMKVGQAATSMSHMEEKDLTVHIIEIDEKMYNEIRKDGKDPTSIIKSLIKPSY